MARTPTPTRGRSLTESFGLEIDRLIRSLPNANPSLRDSAEQPAVRPLTAHPSPAAGGLTSGALRSATPGRRQSLGTTARAIAEAPPTAQGAWARGALALTLAVSVMFWPYAAPCGWTLAGYALAVGCVTLAGAWTAWTAWRARAGTAHMLGLLVAYWGVVLAAELVLPRIGYASVRAVWAC